MKFSVLVPVYNVQDYLVECVESVINQTYKNFELILVDDGSTDNSGRICDEYSEKYPFIRAYHKENKGLLHTRRFAFSKACGDCYICLDSDDSIRPETLQTVFDAMQKYDADCVIYEFQRHENGIPLETVDSTKPIKVIEDKRELFRMVLLDYRYNSICRKAIKSSIIKNTDIDNLPDVVHGEDLLQSLEIMENSKRTVVLPQPLYNYRINEKSITHTKNYENYPVNFLLEEEILNFLKRMDVYQEKDYEEYGTFSRSQVVETIRTIASFDTSYKNKVELFEEIKAARYYQDFIKKLKNKKNRRKIVSIIHFLFETSHYRMIVFVERMICASRKFR